MAKQGDTITLHAYIPPPPPPPPPYKVVPYRPGAMGDNNTTQSLSAVG